MSRTKLSQQDLLDSLALVERLASGSRFKRFCARPLAYLDALAYKNIRYPLIMPGGNRTAHTFFHVPMKVVLPAAIDIYITGGKTHDSEIRLSRFLIRALKPGQTFVDVGAHFGFFSLLGSVLVGREGAVYAIEASRRSYRVLIANSKQFENVRAIHCAVSDQNVQATFYEFPQYYSEYNTLDAGQFVQERWFDQSRPVPVLVQAKTLDELAESGWATDLIKIDVEGAEDKAVQGAMSLLKSQHPIVVIEYLRSARNNAPHRRAAKLLTELGYTQYIILQDGTLKTCCDLEGHLAARSLDSENVVFL